MAVVIFDVALYSRTPRKKLTDCEWRKFLNSIDELEYKDLNYGTVTDLEPVLEPLNSWIDENEPRFVESSFPFVIYRKADSKINGGNPVLVIHRTIESLLNDSDLRDYKC